MNREQLLNQINSKLNTNYGLETDETVILELEDLLDIMQSYAKDMCELQKQECVNNTQALARWCGDDAVDEESILDCKNVCDNETEI